MVWVVCVMFYQINLKKKLRNLKIKKSREKKNWADFKKRATVKDNASNEFTDTEKEKIFKYKKLFK